MATAVGVDVGGTKILGIAVEDTGRRVGVEVRRPTPHGAPALLDTIVGVIAEVHASAGDVDAVGLGVPGLVDRGGRLAVGPNLPGITDFEFRDELHARLNRPVAVDNDATCATWAEVQIGAAKGATEAFLVTLGTGIGGGLVCGGVLQRGANGFAGEPGHMVVDPKGPNLPGIIDFEFRDELHARLNRPVAVDNDATCATWAEVQIGAAKGATEAFLVTLGTGIGGGLVCGGVLQRGANGFAGEPGHMVVDPKGPPCPCGRRGCWERFASGSGLARLAREAAEAGRGHRLVELAGGDVEAVRGEHVTRAAAEGDTEAIQVFRDFGWWAALGIANLVNILDPEVAVVGGGLVDAGEIVMAPIRAAFDELVLAGEHRPRVRIEPAALGGHAGAIGAALIAFDRA